MNPGDLSQSRIPRYFPALTGLRTIAAFLVFFHHHANIPYQQNKVYWFFYMLGQESHVGVSVFFVLSGFLVAWRYLEEAKLNKAWLKKYFINRFAKIWPLYWVMLGLCFGVSRWPDDRLNIFLNLTLLKGFFDSYKFTGIGQAWSLTVEETFYFFAPWIFVFIQKKPKSLIRTFFLVPLFLGIGWVLLRTVGFRLQWYNLFYDRRFVLFYTFFGRCFEFFLGIFLARLLLKWDRGTIRRPHLPKIMTSTGVLGMFACLCFMIFYVRPRGAFFEASGMILLNGIMPLFIGSLIFGLIHEDTSLRRMLSTKTCGVLGKSSYAFYLLDMTYVIQYFSPLYANSFVVGGGVLSCAIKFTIMNVIAILLYFLVENPLNHLIRGLFGSEPSILQRIKSIIIPNRSSNKSSSLHSLSADPAKLSEH